jgi:flavorubredoxin
MLPVNVCVLQSREPVLIDSGLIAEHDQFMATLQSVMDPRHLRWLRLTHPDPDHVGSLRPATIVRGERSNWRAPGRGARSR